MRKILFLILISQVQLVHAQNSKVTIRKDVLEYYKRIRTYEILFELNSDSIRPESFKYLDSLSTVIIGKGFNVEIGVHVDTRWNPEYSSSTSSRRAEKIREYFIETGISSDKIIAKGYDDSDPIIKEKDVNLLPEDIKEYAHQINRRVEFILTKTR